MKFRITMKDPDGVGMSLDEEADTEVTKLDLSDEEKELVKGLRREKMAEFASKWIEFSEYLTIEFDTDEGTATVVETP